MLHLRLVVPTNVTDDVLSLLEGDAAVTNVVLLPGAARSPAGDVILADVAREGANAVIDCLRGLDVDKTGSIAVENVDVALSQTAREAQRAAPGEGADAVVWEEVANRTHDDATLFDGVHLPAGRAVLGGCLSRPRRRHAVADVGEVRRARRRADLGHDSARCGERGAGVGVRGRSGGKGSLVQLGINLGSIVVAGCLTLIVQQYVWSRRQLQARRSPDAEEIYHRAQRR